MSRERILNYFGISYVITESSGVNVLTDEGRLLIDALSQYGALPFGSSFKPLFDQVKNFFNSKSPTLVQPFTTLSTLDVKKRLICMLGEDRFSNVIFTNSGAESVEAAVKIVRSRTGKPGIIALKNSFHGKTMAAVQLTSNPRYREYFCIENNFVRHIDVEMGLDDIEKSVRCAAKEVQASSFIIELVQGEGGMRALDREKISHAVKVARDIGLYIIVDEIQTGLGRTGPLFSFQEYAIDPDIVLLGKALGGGIVSLSACITTEDVIPSDFTIFHSSTFSNNNFSSYVCNIVLDLLNEDLLENVRLRGEQLGFVLDNISSRYPEIYEKSSGRGLMRGIHLKCWNDPGSFFSNTVDEVGLTGYAAAAWLIRNRGLITMPCFSQPMCIRVQPPLIVTEKEIDRIYGDFSSLAEMLISSGGYANLFVFKDLNEENNKGKLKYFPLLNPGNIFPIKDRINSSLMKKTKVKNNLPDGRFVFVIHPIDSFSFERTFPDSYYKLLSNDKLSFQKSARDLLKVLPNLVSQCYEIEALDLGDKLIEGNLVTLSLFPDELMSLSENDRRQLLVAIGREVTRLGPDVLGLGAFSSILAKGGYSFRHLNMTVTAGSSLTAAAAVDVAWRDGFDLEDGPRFGVVGPSGGVGLRVWQFLIYQILQTGVSAEVYLLYNPRNPHALKTIDKHIKMTIEQLFDVCSSDQGVNVSPYYKTRIDRIRKIFFEESHDASLQIIDRARHAFEKVLGFPVLSVSASDDQESICHLNSIIVATDSSHPLDLLLNVKKGCRVYDLGRPHSFDINNLQNHNIKLYEAGLVSLPNPKTKFGSFNMCALPDGISLGCLAETMVLTASGDELRPPSWRGIFLHSLRIFEKSRALGMVPVALPVSQEIFDPQKNINTNNGGSLLLDL